MVVILILPPTSLSSRYNKVVDTARQDSCSPLSSTALESKERWVKFDPVVMAITLGT